MEHFHRICLVGKPGVVVAFVCPLRVPPGTAVSLRSLWFFQGALGGDPLTAVKRPLALPANFLDVQCAGGKRTSPFQTNTAPALFHHRNIDGPSERPRTTRGDKLQGLPPTA